MKMFWAKNFVLLISLTLFSTEAEFRVRAQTTDPKSAAEKSPAPPETTFGNDENPVVDDGGEIKIDATLVNVPVSVSDKNGRFISNLSAKDFRVYENGVEQTVDYFASTEQPFVVVLLLDVSGSVRFDLKNIKKAARAFLDQLQPADKIVGIAFSEQLKVLNSQVHDRDGLRKEIDNIEVGGSTYLYATVEVVSNRLLRRFDGRKALVLLTDGIDANFNGVAARSTYETSLRAAEKSGAIVYAVQFKSDAEGENETANSYLESLAERTGGRMFRARKIKRLPEAFAAVAEELRRQYSLGYYPKTPARTNERRAITVRVNQPGANVRARDGYIVQP